MNAPAQFCLIVTHPDFLDRPEVFGPFPTEAKALELRDEGDAFVSGCAYTPGRLSSPNPTRTVPPKPRADVEAEKDPTQGAFLVGMAFGITFAMLLVGATMLLAGSPGLN